MNFWTKHLNKATAVQLGLCLVVFTLSLTVPIKVLAVTHDPYLDDYHDSKYDADPNDLLTNAEPIAKSSCHIRIEVSVQHNDKPIETFTCYPYPVRPPTPKTNQMGLPTSRKGIKGFLLNSGYSMRSENMYAYPMFGWRWQYAYHAALRKYPGTVPHSLASLYPWIDDMEPLVLVECKRINAQEKERHNRWKKAVEDFDSTHDDIEHEASQQGLTAMPVRMSKRYLGSADIPPGTWWISGSHKVAGLTYYWIQPVTLSAGDNQTFVLNEDNAIFIEGGW